VNIVWHVDPWLQIIHDHLGEHSAQAQALAKPCGNRIVKDRCCAKQNPQCPIRRAQNNSKKPICLLSSQSDVYLLTQAQYNPALSSTQAARQV